MDFYNAIELTWEETGLAWSSQRVIQTGLSTWRRAWEGWEKEKEAYRYYYKPLSGIKPSAFTRWIIQRILIFTDID